MDIRDIDFDKLSLNELYYLQSNASQRIEKLEEQRKENKYEQRKAYLVSHGESFYENDQCCDGNCRLWCEGCDDRCF